MSDEAPSEKQVEQGIAALEPFVRAWDLRLNPEELGEMAYAVLIHVFDNTPTDGIRAAVEAQIAEFAEANLRLRQHVEAAAARRAEPKQAADDGRWD